MKIIIVGAGRTGEALIIALLHRRYNDITVVDRDQVLLDKLTDDYSVNGVVGSGASRETLKKAGADSADVLIAMTPIDETNILSCVQAKSMGTVCTAARVFSQDFSEDSENLKETYGIDFIFNPKYDMAERAFYSIGLPGIVKPEGIFSESMQAFTISIGEDSPLKGYAMSEIRGVLGFDLVVGCVLRDGKIHIPTGTFTIEEGDLIGITASLNEIKILLNKMGVAINPAKRIMIVGGGVTTHFLIPMLLKENRQITVIEKELDACRQLMEEFPSITVSYGYGDKEEVLEQEKIGKCDVILALTDNDEVNLVTSLYGWYRNVPSVLTKIESPGQLAMLHKINLNITLSPSAISVNKMIRFIHNCDTGIAPSNIEKYCTIAGNRADVFQFTVPDNYEKEGVMISDPGFKLKKDVIITAITRYGKTIVPDHKTSLLAGDKVYIVSDRKIHIENLNDIFS